MNVYEIVTKKIIESLEQGVIPWRKTWNGEAAVNWVTRKPYRGINRLLLDDGEYMSYKQIVENKGSVKKGAKSHIVIFWKWYEKATDDNGEMKIERLPVLRYYRVFHISDCIGIESKFNYSQNVPKSLSAEKVMEDYTQHHNINLKTITGSKSAYYNPQEDCIVLPDIKQFESSESYYSVAFHELIHSTGNKTRLDRIRTTAFASEEYSKEELVAEIGSAMLMNETGLNIPDTFHNSVAYINSWLSALKEDSHMVVIAAAQAQKAVELILGKELSEDE